MSKAEDIRRRIASGELKKRTGGGGGPGAGNYSVLIVSAEYAPGETNPENRRGRVSFKVVGADDTANIGKKFYDYFQTVNEKFMEEKLAEWLEYATAWKIDEKYIYDRAETGVEMTANLMIEINRMSVKGNLILDVERVLRDDKGPKGQDQYWNNFSNARLAEKAFKITPEDSQPDSPDESVTSSKITMADVNEVLSDATLDDALATETKAQVIPPAKVTKPKVAATPAAGKKTWQV